MQLIRVIVRLNTDYLRIRDMLNSITWQRACQPAQRIATLDADGLAEQNPASVGQAEGVATLNAQGRPRSGGGATRLFPYTYDGAAAVKLDNTHMYLELLTSGTLTFKEI